MRVTKQTGPLFDAQHAFAHAIDFDVSRLVSIIRNGILSAKAAAQRGVPFGANYPIFNGPGEISVALLPKNGRPSECFSRYITPNLGFVAEGMRTIHSDEPRGAMPQGEAQVVDRIPPDKLRAITIPRAALSTRISELPLLLPGLPHLREERVNAIIRCLEHDFGYSLSPDVSERAVAARIGKSSATLADLLGLVAEKLPIYDNNGFPLRGEAHFTDSMWRVYGRRALQVASFGAAIAAAGTVGVLALSGIVTADALVDSARIALGEGAAVTAAMTGAGALCGAVLSR